MHNLERRLTAQRKLVVILPKDDLVSQYEQFSLEMPLLPRYHDIDNW